MSQLNLNEVFDFATESSPEGDCKPMAVTHWSSQAFDLLYTLSRRVPILSESHAIELLTSAGLPHSSAVEELNILRQMRWIERFRCVTSWREPLFPPVLTWRPGDEAEDLRRLRVAARVTEPATAPRDVCYFVASRVTANLFGGSYRGTANAELIGQWMPWSRLYLHLREHCPQVANRCDSRGIPHPGERAEAMPPHLVFTTAEGVKKGVIAHLSTSSAHGLLTLHKHCVAKSLPYLLW
jgi:hypothetical protein